MFYASLLLAVLTSISLPAASAEKATEAFLQNKGGGEIIVTGETCPKEFGEGVIAYAYAGSGTTIFGCGERIGDNFMVQWFNEAKQVVAVRTYPLVNFDFR